MIRRDLQVKILQQYHSKAVMEDLKTLPGKDAPSSTVNGIRKKQNFLSPSHIMAVNYKQVDKLAVPEREIQTETRAEIEASKQ